MLAPFTRTQSIASGRGGVASRAAVERERARWENASDLSVSLAAGVLWGMRVKQDSHGRLHAAGVHMLGVVLDERTIYVRREPSAKLAVALALGWPAHRIVVAPARVETLYLRGTR